MARGRRGRSRWLGLAVFALVAGILTARDLLEDRARPVPPPAGRARSAPAEELTSEPERLLRAIRERESGVPVEVEAPVVHLLPDDLRGSRHQRFLIDVGAERAVLVSHNIDLAPRIDALARGDRVAVRGQFEWNEKGGVIHWTHHDPDGRRPGGWIRHRARTYR